ncbi:hypothetical protein D9M69_680580 [compost metagenome]
MGKVIDDVDHALSLVGRQRKVVLAVPQFSALPGLLAGSDMVAIVPDYVAKAMARLEGMHIEFAPLDLSTPDLFMAWRGASHIDPRERWLRSYFCRYLCQQLERPALAA